MSNKTIRVIFTRPNLGVQFPNDHFLTATKATAATFRGLAATNNSYASGGNGLLQIVDHTFDDSVAFETNRSAIMAMIPFWKNESNASEVDSYNSTYNIVINIVEVDGIIDHSSFDDITDI